MYSVTVLSKNKEILDAVLRWRSLSVETLIDLVGEKYRISNMRQRVYRLEKYGLLKSKLSMHCKKIIYPSFGLLDYSGLTKKGAVNEDNLRHDSYVASICSSLIHYEYAKKIELPHEYKTKSSWKYDVIEPDAIMTLEQNNEKFQIAIEVELWRKERSRVYEKMIDYAKAVEYDYAFYFFADEFSFNSYVLRHKELLTDNNFSFLREDILNKIGLILMANKENRLRDLSNSKVYHGGNIKTLKELIGV